MTGMRITAPRAIITLVVGLALAVALAAQERPAPATPPPAAQAPAQPPANPDQPVFRTGINTVRVDVIVSDKQGNPVSDLKQADFEVFEDGKPQKVDTFRLVNIDAVVAPSYTQHGIRTRNDEETAAADENARIFVFFLDDYHVKRDSSMGIRKTLTEFIANQLSPNDLIGVMYPLTPIDAVVLTRNHQGVINTIEKFMGRKYDYQPMNDLEAGYIYKLTPDQVELIRRGVTLSALRGISVKLGSLREGRKSLLLLSEGFSSLLPPQLRSNQPAGYSGVGDLTRDPFAADNNTLEDRARFSADMDLQNDLRDVFDTANRNNTAIYSIDPRGLAIGDFDITANISMQTSQQQLNSSMDTLRVLSENTDGRAIVNRNDIGPAMKQIIRDASAYYLVGYTSNPAPTDGKFHEIKVKVKRPGVQVRSRKGYWAYTEADVARATAGPKAAPPNAVGKALAAITPMNNHRLVRTWIGTSRGANGLTKVTFLWEPLPASPGVRRDEARRVTLLASSGGQLIYRAKVPADLAGIGAGAATSFDVKPGKLDLKITIEGDGTGTLDSEERELAIPDLSAPEVLFSTPRVWFARNAREFQVLAADTKTAPTALREFRRTDRLLLRFDAFVPADSPLTATARLLNQEGTKMSDVTVAAPTEAGQPYTLDLPLANLAAGQYLIELTAKTEGHEPVTELVAFRVTQ
ncbi:MAG: VWA domain-containing protein [Vicinamibacterales bacterium]